MIHTFVLRLRHADDDTTSLAGEVEQVATGTVTRVNDSEHLLAVLWDQSGGRGSRGHPEGTALPAG